MTTLQIRDSDGMEVMSDSGFEAEFGILPPEGSYMGELQFRDMNNSSSWSSKKGCACVRFTSVPRLVLLPPSPSLLASTTLPYPPPGIELAVKSNGVAHGHGRQWIAS
ncbi:hypothetical protein PM082_020215 [Marasmius tenuissimus]|nr:hypothetical protein PM082_020215 [Marasmius tenuissimus]